MNNIHTDTPAKEDLLNRKPFAAQIARQVVTGFTNEHEGIVLGINGTWGSGKTTLLSFIRESIEYYCDKNDVKYLIYQFNPWMFSGQEALQREFLEGLLHLLKDTFKSRAEWQKWAKERLAYFSFVKFIPNIGDDLHATLEKMIKGLDSFTSLHDLKSKVDNLLIEENHRLFIFLDDLDRLTPSETIEMFRLIKLNTNFKNTVFVAAYDRFVVEHALKHQYGHNSSRYLEKIIQIDFKIPEILSEKILEIFILELNKIFAKTEIEFNVDDYRNIWKKAELYKIFRGVRDIYRFTNAISFTLPSIHQEINVSDFILLEIIRIFDNEGYERLYLDMFSKRTLLQTSYFEQKQISEFCDKTQPIINILLPSKDGISKSKTPKRLADFGYFERYFSLQISSYDISESEFIEYLTAANKIGILKNIADGGRLGDFWGKLANIYNYSNHNEVDYQSIFYSIFELLDDDFLLKSWFDLMFKTINQVFNKSSDIFNIGNIFIDCLCRPVSRMSFSRYLITYWYIDDIHQKHGLSNDNVQLFIKQKQLELKQSLQKFHDDWFSHLLSTHVWEKPCYALELPAAYYAKQRKEEYIIQMERILQHDKCVLGLSKKFAMFIDDEGRPHRYNSELYYNLLPAPLDSVYTKRLEDVLLSLPDGRDKLLVKFFTSTLVEQKKND